MLGCGPPGIKFDTPATEDRASDVMLDFSKFDPINKTSF